MAVYSFLMKGESMFSRNEIIYKKENLEKLKNKRIAIYGLGGVGMSAAISLVRAGIGNISVLDFDTISKTNLNRLACTSTLNLEEKKVDFFEKIAKNINPKIKITKTSDFVKGENVDQFFQPNMDFYIDAIDSLNPKVNLIVSLLEQKTKFISIMGTGGRRNPTKLKITDFWKTEVCPLARFVRKRLRNRKIYDKFFAVWSDENPIAPIKDNKTENQTEGRTRKIQGSNPFVPQTAGLFAGYFAIEKILEKND